MVVASGSLEERRKGCYENGCWFPDYEDCKVTFTVLDSRLCEEFNPGSWQLLGEKYTLVTLAEL